MAVIKSKEPFRDKKNPKNSISSSNSQLIRNTEVKEGQKVILQKAEIPYKNNTEKSTPKSSFNTAIHETPPHNFEDEIALKRKQMEATLRQEQDALRQKAHKEGYERGYEEGKSQFSTLSKQMLDAVNSIITERNKVLEQNETVILELAIAIARKVTQSTVKEHPEVFQNIFQEALNKVTDKAKVLVRVNPDELKLAQHYTSSLQEELNDFKTLEIIGDAEIEHGGCVIETNLGYIDSSIATKFHIIESALKNVQQGRK